MRLQRKKKDQTKMREMERDTIQHLPLPGLQEGWTEEEMATHQSNLARGNGGECSRTAGPWELRREPCRRRDSIRYFASLTRSDGEMEF